MHSHIHTPEYLYWWQKFLPHVVMGGKFGCDSQSAVLYFVLGEPIYVTKLQEATKCNFLLLVTVP